MNFELTQDQRMLRDQITKFARQELSDGVMDRDRNQEFPHDLWLKCGEMGLQGLPIDEEFGGSGLDSVTTAVALEALGYGCRDGGLVFAICAHLLACTIPIWKHGSDEQKKKYLPKLCSGEMIAVNGMTETTSGSDAFNMATRAEPDGDGFRINGVKTFSSNGPVADLAVVYAVTDPAKKAQGGVTGFVIEKDTPGFRASQKFEKMGLRTALLGELVMEDVYVPKEAVLGGVGGGLTVFSESMEWERVLIGATHVGNMRHLLEKAVQYAKERRAYGQPIGRYQAISHKLADIKINLEAARLLVYHAASRLGRARDNAMNASIVKTFVSEALVQAALDTVQVFGGHGFLTEHEVERVLRDAVGGTLYSGANEIQRNIIAGWLGLPASTKMDE